MPKSEFIVFSDGGARGNPGRAASAFAVIEKGAVVHKSSKYLGVKTNNFAEYTAVLSAIKWIKINLNKLSQNEIVINVDSELVQKQLTGVYKIKSKNLSPLIAKIKQLEENLKTKIVYKWTPRNKNRIADSLVNKELDRHNNFTSRK